MIHPTCATRLIYKYILSFDTDISVSLSLFFFFSNMDLSLLSNTSATTPLYDLHHHHHQSTTKPDYQASTTDHQHKYIESSRSAFHAMPSPPELLHDSEEDEEAESTGSATPSLPPLQHDLPCLPSYRGRKSVPHRSPPAIKDAFQASALDKSVVFQLDVRSHPFFPAPKTTDAPRDRPVTCPECKLTTCCGMACTSRVICGESLLTALRKRVTEARKDRYKQRRGVGIQRPAKRAARRTTHIEIPAPYPLPHAKQTRQQEEEEVERRRMEIRRRPWIEDTPPAAAEEESVVETKKEDQEQEESVQAPAPQPARSHHATSGRPSRVKGPCQACHETSDGCMRKAFDWPFPTSAIYNDKGKPFVYLCNKCGLRYGFDLPLTLSSLLT